MPELSPPGGISFVAGPPHGETAPTGGSAVRAATSVGASFGAGNDHAGDVGCTRCPQNSCRLVERCAAGHDIIHEHQARTLDLRCEPDAPLVMTSSTSTRRAPLTCGASRGSTANAPVRLCSR